MVNSITNTKFRAHPFRISRGVTCRQTIWRTTKLNVCFIATFQRNVAILSCLDQYRYTLHYSALRYPKSSLNKKHKDFSTYKLPILTFNMYCIKHIQRVIYLRWKSILRHIKHIVSPLRRKICQRLRKQWPIILRIIWNPQKNAEILCKSIECVVQSVCRCGEVTACK
jgi:hypothetical protein